MDKSFSHIDTLCVHGGQNRDGHFGAVSLPIYQTATFAHPGVGRSTGYDYSRTANPTREGVERHIAALDGVRHALGFSTGMAAAACLMETFKPGERVLVADDLYGGTIRLFDSICRKNGLVVEAFGNEARLNELAEKPFAAVFIETPTNPMLNVIDIRLCAEIAHKNNALLIVDNTFLTPVCQRVFELGADIALYSATKYLGGHNDTLAGFLTADDDALAERLKFLHKTTGACLSPMDAFLIERGLKTLALRVKRQNDSALIIAEWLKTRQSVTNVYYPGLPEHPGHNVAKSQSSGFGGMISVRVDSEKRAVYALERAKLFQYAESLGGVDSLITYPTLQTHADVPIEQRLAKGIDERLLRLSIGIEDVNDLIEDLSQVL